MTPSDHIHIPPSPVPRPSSLHPKCMKMKFTAVALPRGLIIFYQLFQSNLPDLLKGKALLCTEVVCSGLTYFLSYFLIKLFYPNQIKKPSSVSVLGKKNPVPEASRIKESCGGFTFPRSTKERPSNQSRNMRGESTLWIYIYPGPFHPRVSKLWSRLFFLGRFSS